MNLEVYFHYLGEEKPPEAPEAFGVLLSALVDCNRELAQEWGVWPSFIDEYRRNKLTLAEAIQASQGQTASEAEEFNEEEYNHVLWQSITPIEPSEVADWVARWLLIIDLLDTGEFRRAFPYICGRDSDEDVECTRKWLIEELTLLAAQSRCAVDHKLMLSFLMMLG